MRLTHAFPDSLVGRTILVLVLGLLLSQVAVIVLFSLNSLDLAAHVGQRQIADRIAAHVQLMEATPVEERRRVLRAASVEGLHARISQTPLVATDANRGAAAVLRQELQSRFAGYEIRASEGGPPPPPPEFDDNGRHPRGMHGPRFDPSDESYDGPPPHGFNDGPGRGDSMVRVSVKLADGTWLNFVAPRRFGQPLWRPRIIAPLGLGLIVVLALSVWAVRRAAQPLAVLAAAAQRLGRDVGAPPMPIEGPREVRAAALAFNEMQTRLRRFVDDRTQMVAAISHDLRTPITRLKLRAEFVEDEEQRSKILADLDEMETMIAQTLAFARDDAAREPRSAVDLAALLAELSGQFGATYAGPEEFVANLGLTAMKRAFANLLENAQKYGNGATTTLSVDKDTITVVIDDHGAGIPEADIERVFQPFVRVEASRNRDTGGTGLGLAVARTAIRAHGGDIVLANRPEGGLRATVSLPR